RSRKHRVQYNSFAVHHMILLMQFIYLNSNTKVGCVFGGSCVLPCRFQPNGDMIFHWGEISGKKLQVHSYYDDQDQLGYQDPLYKGRTSLFNDQISGGNASLGLARVNLQDQGRYLCQRNLGRIEYLISPETNELKRCLAEVKNLVGTHFQAGEDRSFSVGRIRSGVSVYHCIHRPICKG
uniref:Immunoglobulin V-set domain-containing protein n=1 Tax=Gadus morhua TaxID=8049 RepID=A0A8C5BXC4_GADMO